MGQPDHTQAAKQHEDAATAHHAAAASHLKGEDAAALDLATKASDKSNQAHEATTGACHTNANAAS